MVNEGMVVAQLLQRSQRCGTMRELKCIQARALRHRVLLHPVLLGRLLRFAAVSPSGDLRHAVVLFSLHPRPSTFLLNTLLRGYARSPSPHLSLLLFSRLRRLPIPSAPDSFTLTFLLTAASRFPSPLPHSQPLHSLLLKLGLSRHLHVQNALLHLYAARRSPSLAALVLRDIPHPDVVSWSGILDAYALSGDIDGARKVFDQMPERDVVSWTSLISAYARAGLSTEALALFRQMRAAGVPPDEVAMVAAVNACASLRDLDAGLGLHLYAEESGFSWMVSLRNALIDMYSKCGWLDRAREVFDGMPRRSVITWNSMISACAMHGSANKALGLFWEMVERSALRPDGVTFLGAMTACAHKGLVEEGWRLFAMMEREHGIKAGVEHYGCMVDMLARAGQLEEAYEMTLKMPVPSNDVVWGALLGACRIYRNVEMAEKVLKRLIELKPNEGGYYVSLCNIYEEAGRREKAMEMRRVMREKGARKTTGCSWVGTEIPWKSSNLEDH